MIEKQRKFTETECVANGGHFWKYYRANDCVDKNFNHTGQRHLMYFPNGEPEYRGCPLCGKVERHIDRWE